jgi:hypothetical protein
MNTRVDAFSRQFIRGSATQGDTGTWLAAIVCTLAVILVAAVSLPGALILPAVAAGLYAGAVGTVLATRRSEPSISEKGWLFAGILFVAGIVASAASDLDGMLAYFG